MANLILLLAAVALHPWALAQELEVPEIQAAGAADLPEAFPTCLLQQNIHPLPASSPPRLTASSASSSLPASSPPRLTASSPSSSSKPLAHLSALRRSLRIGPRPSRGEAARLRMGLLKTARTLPTGIPHLRKPHLLSHALPVAPLNLAVPECFGVSMDPSMLLVNLSPPPGSLALDGFMVPWSLCVIGVAGALLFRLHSHKSKVEGSAQDLLLRVERERRSMSILGSFRWLMRLSLLAEGAEEGWQLAAILLALATFSVAFTFMLVQNLLGQLSLLTVLLPLGVCFVTLLALLPFRAHLTERRTGWALLSMAMFCLHTRIFIDVQETHVTAKVTDALTALDGPTYAWSFRSEVAMVLTSTLFYFFTVFACNNFCVFLRESLTNRLLTGYLANRKYYELDLITGEVDNPDQRIQDDLFQFSVMLQYVGLSGMDAVFRTFIFGSLIATVDTGLLVGLLCFILFFVTLFVALTRMYTHTNALQQALEADFRYSLVHLRDHGEAVAYYGGEAHERKVFDSKFGAAVSNYQVLMLLAGCVQTFFVGYGPQATTVANYISGNLRIAQGQDMGIIASSGAAFSHIIIAASFPVMLCGDLSKSLACIVRVAHLLEKLNTPAEPPEIVSVLSKGTSGEAQKLELRDVEVQTPNKQRTLVRGLTASFQEQANTPFSLLIVGSSGIGKSSLLRVLLGLWTRGQGEVHRPLEHECVFLPQRPYMPQGSLRNQLIYPENEGDESVLRELLALFDLEELPSRFEGGFQAVRPWAKVLSLGEQQRIALVRCLRLQRRMAMLDEATSALPSDMEAALYKELQRRNVCYVSVGHRESLLRYHKQVLRLNANGNWQVVTSEEHQRELQKLQLI